MANLRNAFATLFGVAVLLMVLLGFIYGLMELAALFMGVFE